MSKLFKCFCLSIALTPINVLSSEKSSDGMPQLDSSTYPSLIFWLLITFAITFFILKNFITPKISDTLMTRQSKLENDLQAAKKSKEEADTHRMEQELALKDAKMQSSKKYKQIINQIKTKIIADEIDLNSKLNAKFEEGEKKILESKQKSLTKLNEITTDISSEIMIKLINIKISKEAIRRVVDINSRNFNEINENKSK